MNVPPAAQQSERGLYGKFRVERVDGRDAAGGDREDARYFVLDYVHDRHARVALRAYADSCRADYPQLAADLDAVLADLVGDTPHRAARPDDANLPAAGADDPVADGLDGAPAR